MVNTELTELLDFLKIYQPLSALSHNTLSQYAATLSLSYRKKGAKLFTVGSSNNKLYMIRSGAVALYNTENILITTLAEGAFFGYVSMLKDKPIHYQAVCVDDCLLLECSKQNFDEFRHHHSAFDKYFTHDASDHISMAAPGQVDSPLSLYDVGEILSREAVCVEDNESIHFAAQKMTAENVSALLVMQGQTLKGILTDKDLRHRVIAKAMDVSLPVTHIMTSKPITVDVRTSLACAQLQMMQENIHHLPVIENDNVKGLVTVNDIIRLQADHPVFMVRDIGKQKKLKGLVTISTRVPKLFCQLVRMGTKASDVGCTMTNITDAITKRLVALAFEKFGHPPIAYAWLALGSQARKEQTAKTDQDNALVLASGATQEQIKYFLKIAHFVNDGLDACGYVYCPGEIMASNPKWCQSIDDWKHDFRQWILQPEPKALMHVKIFFDLRCIDGDESLISELQDEVASHAKHQQIFLSLLYKISLEFQPPIGFFRKFVLNNKGEHKDTLDLKHNGLVPIVDLARIYMLSSGHSEEYTLKRLKLAASVEAITQQSADNLLDAFEFISFLRIQHQERQLSQGIKPDNYISPQDLSPLMRDQLRSAFEVIATLQKALGQCFSGV
jgi:CBS domain-containing protein